MRELKNRLTDFSYFEAAEKYKKTLNPKYYVKLEKLRRDFARTDMGGTKKIHQINEIN
jgi:hypothetical protein